MLKLRFVALMLLAVFAVPALAQPTPATPITLDTVGQLQEFHRFGTGTLINAQYAPDGAALVVSTSLGVSRLALDGQDTALVPLDAPNPFFASALALSPDGALIAAGGTDFGLYVWRDGAFEVDLRAHAGAVVALGVSPDGTRLVSAGEDSALIVWDATTLSEVWRSAERSAPATHLAFSPDGQTLVVGQRDGIVLFYDLATGDPIGEGAEPQGGLRSFAVSPDGTRVAGTTFRSSDYWVWDAITGEFVLQARLPIVNGISPEGMDVAFSPDGSSLYVLPLMGDLVRVTVADGAVETVVVTAANPLDSRTALTLSPDGAQAAIVTTNQLLVVNLADGAVVQSLGSPARAADVTFSPDSAQVTGAFSGGLTQVWATVTGERIGSTQVEGAPIVRLASLPSGALAALDQTNTLSLDGLPVVQVMDGFSNYSLLEASASGVFVTQGAEGRGLRIFDGSGAQTREWVNDASANVTAAAVSPDGSLVAYGLESTGFGVFSAADGVVIKGGSLGRGLASALAIAPDNQRLMLASGANVLAYPIDPNSEGGLRPDQTPFVTTATFGAVYDLAISPDGALMAAVGSDGTLWVWDMASGAEVYRSPVLTAPLRSVTFSPDGAWIATAGEDGTVRVWGVR